MLETFDESKLKSELSNLFVNDAAFNKMARGFLGPIYGEYDELASADLELGEVWTFLKLMQALQLVDGYFGSTNITKIFAGSALEKINKIFETNNTTQTDLMKKYEKYFASND